MHQLHTNLLGQRLTFLDYQNGEYVPVPGTVVACWVADSSDGHGRLMVVLGLEDGLLVQKPVDVCRHAAA